MPHFSDEIPEDLPTRVREAFRAHPDLRTHSGLPRRAVAQAGLTNHVYRLEAENGDYFLRLPRPETAGSVDRRSEAWNIARAAELGLALPPVYSHCETGILMTRAVDVLTELPPNFPEKLGTSLGTLHSSGVEFAGELDPDTVFRAQRDVLHPDYQFDIGFLEPLFRKTAKGAERNSTKGLVPSHGDLSPGNCLAVPGGLWLIDWEYSAMADPAWDLAYAILEHGFSKAEEGAFLGAYRGTPAASLCPAPERLEAMKVKCDAVSALWAYEQVARGRNAELFLSFARARRDRALARSQALS